MKKYALLFIFALLLSTLNGIKSHAQDWVMTEADNSVTYISDGWLKSIEGSEEENITFMFNHSKDIIIMIDDANERYAKGSGDDYCNAMKAMRDEMNKQIPPGQAKMMQDMIEEQKAKPAPKVTITKGSGEKIAGYQTDKYSIYVDGELFEEKWMSMDPALKDILQVIRGIVEFTASTASCSVPDESFLTASPEFSAEYKKLEGSGVELKSVSYEFGDADVDSEVVSLEKEDIPSSEFEIPDGYSAINFKDLLMEMSGM
jgi:hypothetical protein